MPDKLLTDYEVAKIIGRARSGLQKDRCRGIGVPYVRVGVLVRYRESDVAAYIDGLPAFLSTHDREPK